jgi:hypothetical protein
LPWSVLGLSRFTSGQLSTTPVAHPLNAINVPAARHTVMRMQSRRGIMAALIKPGPRYGVEAFWKSGGLPAGCECAAPLFVPFDLAIPFAGRSAWDGHCISIMKSRLLLLAICAFALRLSGAPLSFPEQNFAIEVPADWTPIGPLPDTPGAKLLVASQSADRNKKVLVFTTKYSKPDIAAYATGVRQGIKKPWTANGWTIDAERESTTGGLSFVSFAAHTSTGATITAHTTTAGDEVYILQLISNSGATSTDPELQSILQSFRLLAPPKALPLATSSKSAAFEAGEKFGRVIGWVVGSALVAGGILWLISRMKRN